MSSQGANNGPKQGAGKQFVKFSRDSAQRIAKAVRAVEGGNRSGPGVAFDHPIIDSGKPLRIGSFTGSWASASWKVVTLTGTTATANVYNWCLPVEAGPDTVVIFGKANGTNSVVEVGGGPTCRMIVGSLDLKTLTGYDASQVQVLGHNTTGPCLQWYSVTTCATATAA